MGSSPLSVRPGYTVTITQLEGARPELSVECRVCLWRESIPFHALDAADPVAVGAAVLAGIAAWLTHRAEERAEGICS